MSKQRQMGGGQRRFRRSTLQAWGYYLLALTAWVTIVLVVSVLGFIICRSLIWYETNPLYHLLNWVRDYYFFVFAFVILVGWVVISYYFIARPNQQLQALIEASGQLSQPTEEPIRLPPAMKSVEDQLNLAREEALHAQRTAREAEQRKNDLVVYLAHDLKTPLTSVIGYLTLLRDEPQISPELRARYTGIALDKAERLEDLINEFFDITRFNLSHLELEKQTVDLSRMLQQVVSEFEPMLAEEQLTCTLDLPARMDYPCDPDKLARVFDNLLRNACHYSTPGTEVQISGAETDTSIVLTFHNEGRTIPPEKLERIFDQFFRLDSSRATRTGGAGLGLAIAKEIVELHGGTISARSWDNQVEFQVTLPKAGREGDFHG
ncbi:sensor histidine kinase [Pseudoflavonifractor capillosus]|uniref:sensor histidine kinase n=1 Tax=Pseudoflavonifractor capillosus TaxID=106588 RepID=UPI001D43DDC5|nr:HAMP domain-containing histidine kinase [Pseudoflavonifractor capillosus]